MSLHALAGHMAAKGRGPDSMLVHMTPDEVQSLQTMARAQGGEVTINPETGLPEAGFLSDTLKALAPMALGAVLGPAGFGLSATMAGVATGGITALATGSLSRGLMAGMGAYGGAGLAEGLANMGSSAIGADALAAANADPNAIASLTAAKDAATAAGTAAPSGLSAVSEGAKRAFTSAEGFKELGNTMGGMGKLASTGLAAISPIMAAEGVQTATPRQDTGYIRQKKFNPYTQQYVDLEPVKASEWGGRKFSDYAGGGIVALAEGGGLSIADMYKQYAGREADPGGAQYWTEKFGSSVDPTEAAAFQTAITEARTQGTEPAAQTYAQYTPQQINDYIANNNLSGNALDEAIKQFNVNPADVAAAQNTQSLISNIYQNVLGRDVDPSGLAYWTGQLTNSGRTGQEMYQEFLAGAQANNELVRPNISLDEAVKQYGGYASADSRNIADEWVRNTLGREVTAADRQTDWYKKAQDAAIMNSYGAAQDIYSNFQNYARQSGSPVKDLDLISASQLLAPAKVVPKVGLPGGGVGTTDTYTGGVSTTPATYAPPGTTNPYGNYMNPGDITRNPDGSTTVHPNIPGRPYGGFTGIQQVKDAYTAGGGSLGQSNLFVPKAIEDMYSRYGNTGGSQQAYDYLMGKGSVDIKKPITKTGELMLPYSEAVLGMPASTAAAPATQKYVFDRKTRQYVLNPAYIDPNAPKEEVKKEPVVANTLLATEAANGGIMRMALGGLSALAGGGQAQYNLGGYSDGGRLLRGPGDGVSDSIPATIGDKQPARLADGEFVVPARIVSELGNGSTEAGARKLYAMMDRVQKARGKTTGKNRVAANTRADKYLPA